MAIKLKIVRHVEGVTNHKRPVKHKLVVEHAQSAKTSPRSEVRKKSSTKIKKEKTIHELVKVGQKIPEFSMLSSKGGVVSNESLLGTAYVLYFYPKDMTSGCTTEAIEFSQISKQFAEKGLKIFGVSGDSLDSHLRFIEKESIKFPLLVDGANKFALRTGARSLSSKRTTFVINEKGVITQVYKNVKAKGHAVCVLEDIKNA